MFELIAGIASIAGLGFSIWAAIAAQGARSAARQATRAARRSSASEDLSRLKFLAKEFLVHVESADARGAAIRAGDLLADIEFVRVRWKRFFPSGAAEELARARGQVLVARKLLTASQTPVAPRENERILEMIHMAFEILERQCGSLIASAEETEE